MKKGKQSAVHMKGNPPRHFRPKQFYKELKGVLQHELHPMHVWCKAMKCGCDPQATGRICRGRYSRLYNKVLGPMPGY